MDRENVIKGLEALQKSMSEHQCYTCSYKFIETVKEFGTNIIEDAITLLKEQGYAMIKEPDCRICGQSHCKYYHELQKPTECKSYIRMEGR